MTSFYDIKAKKLSGEVVSMADYKGKVVLVENTATLWGTTVRDFTQMNELCEKVETDPVFHSLLDMKIKHQIVPLPLDIIFIDPTYGFHCQTVIKHYLF